MIPATLFDGITFSPALDGPRLETALGRVQALMRDGRWRTLDEVARAAGCSQAGASARLRDLRKLRFGGYTIERRRRGDPSAGLWEYRMATPGDSQCT